MKQRTGMGLNLFHVLEEAESGNEVIIYHPKDSGKAGVLKVLSEPAFQYSYQDTTVRLCGVIDIDDGDVDSTIEMIRTKVRGQCSGDNRYTFAIDSLLFSVTALPVGIPGFRLSEVGFERSTMDDILLAIAYHDERYQRIIVNAIDMFKRKGDRQPVQKELLAMMSAFVDGDIHSVLGLIRELVRPLTHDDIVAILPGHMLDALHEFIAQ